MLKLEEITKNAAITGIEPGQVVRVVTTEPVGDNALTVYYKTSDGRLLERMLFRTDEATLALAEAGRPWAFDAVGSGVQTGNRGLPHNAGASIRPHDGYPHLERGAPTPPDYGGL